MARKILVTIPLLIVAWLLMVSYQFFTQAALLTVASSLSAVPVISTWISSSSGWAGFICGFAWMFVLSAIVSTLMFGNERRLSIQFLVSLGLTLIGSTLVGVLSNAGIKISDPGFITSPVSVLFGNIVFAWFYLALPFIFMVVIDFRAKPKKW